jgi:hypothetical protein
MTMKKLLTIFFCTAGSCAMAQTVQQTQTTAPKVVSHQIPGTLRLHAYTSYAFDDKVDNYNSATDYVQGTIRGGFEYGGGLEFILRPAYGIELSYLRLDSKVSVDYYSNGAKSDKIDLASNYLMLGANRYLIISPKLEPYFGVELGMGIYNADNQTENKSASATKFAWGIKAGANIWLSDKIGIKIQGGLLSAVQSFGGGLYFGTGGAGAGVTGYSTYYQWTLGGGLIFDINGNKK